MAVDEFFVEGDLKLKPFDDRTKDLAIRAKTHVQQEMELGAKLQAEFNRLHQSKFNPHDLYLGTSYSQRCGEDGTPSPQGQCFRGVELLVFSSVEEAQDIVTIDFLPNSGNLIVHFGKRIGAEPQGLLVNTQDKYNRFRLEKPVMSALKMSGFAPSTKPASDEETIVFASKESPGVVDALKTANVLVTAYLSRLGLEASVYNLIKCRKNVLEITDDNLGGWVKLDDEPRDSYSDIVIITSTRVCRRCKAEWQELFLDYTKAHPDVTFGIAFTDKPKLKFIPKVFDQDCGGVRHSGKVTPFFILYKKGIFQYYTATTREEPPPNVHDLTEAIQKYLKAEA